MQQSELYEIQLHRRKQLLLFRFEITCIMILRADDVTKRHVHKRTKHVTQPIKKRAREKEKNGHMK